MQIPRTQQRTVSRSSLAGHIALAARPVLHRLPRGGDRLLGWVRIDRLTSPPERVGRIVGGARIRADLRDRIQRRMYWLGVYERDETRWLRSQLTSGDVFLDVGGHVGYYALVAASRVGSTGAVHCFEPFAENFARLEMNVSLNGFSNVVATPLAVSNVTGEAVFIAPTRTGERGWGSLASAPANGGVRVSTVRLDDYVASRGLTRVTGVKIDIEGAEALAVDGMTEMLARLRPRFVLIELNREALLQHGSSPDSVVSQMAVHGYRPHRLIRHRLEPLTDEDIRRLAFLNLAIFLPGRRVSTAPPARRQA